MKIVVQVRKLQKVIAMIAKLMNSPTCEIIVQEGSDNVNIQTHRQFYTSDNLQAITIT